MHEQLAHQFAVLENDRHEIMQLLERLDDSRLQACPAPGKWSPAQVAWHVAQAETVSFKYIEKRLKNASQYPFITIYDSIYSWFVIFGLQFPVKFKAPASVAVLPEYIPLAEISSHWNAAREKMKEVLEAAHGEELKRALYVHPIAGSMNLFQAMRFMHQHQVRHRGQILRMIG